MYDHLGPPDIPEAGPAELGAVKKRAAERRRNMFIAGAGTGGGAVALIALLIIAIVTSSPGSKDVSTVDRPGVTTSTSIEPPTTLPPQEAPPTTTLSASGPRRSGNGNARRSTGAAASPSQAPKPSPLIAFVFEESHAGANTQGFLDVHVVNLDGSDDHRLVRLELDTTSVGAGLAWTPNANLLGVTTERRHLGVGRTLNLVDRTGRLIRSDAQGTGGVAWSPSSDRYAATYCTSSPCAITVNDAANGETVGTVDKLKPSLFTWQRNERLAAGSDGPNGPGVYSVSADNTDLRSLAPISSGDALNGLLPGPDGRLYFSTAATGLNVVTDEPEPKFTHIADGATATTISPDSRLLAWSTTDSGRSTLWIEQTVGGLPTGPRKLQTPGSCPAFAPDGRLLFKGDGGIWVSDADGSNARLLVATPATACPIPTPA